MARQRTHGTGAVGGDQQLTMLVKPFSLCNLVRVDPRTFGGVPRQAMIFFSAHRTGADHGTFQPSLEAAASDCKFQPVNLDALTVDLGHAFQTVVPQAASWEAGRSTDEFSELLAASKYFEDSPIARLAAALRERANADPEQIELFQAKLPESTIPTHGFFILIVCQFYFLAHLLEMRGLLPSTTFTESLQVISGSIQARLFPFSRWFPWLFSH